MLGGHCTDTSGWGFGAGDLFVSFGKFPGAFIEIKRGPKSELTAHQAAFQRVHPHAVLRCESVDQAVELCGIIRTRAALLTTAACR